MDKLHRNISSGGGMASSQNNWGLQNNSAHLFSMCLNVNFIYIQLPTVLGNELYSETFETFCKSILIMNRVNSAMHVYLFISIAWGHVYCELD